MSTVTQRRKCVAVFQVILLESRYHLDAPLVSFALTKKIIVSTWSPWEGHAS